MFIIFWATVVTFFPDGDVYIFSSGQRIYCFSDSAFLTAIKRFVEPGKRRYFRQLYLLGTEETKAEMDELVSSLRYRFP